VSRPIERCQEMSQCTPIIADVTPSTESQMYHGIFPNPLSQSRSPSTKSVW
jgi:hypothetical protein